MGISPLAPLNRYVKWEASRPSSGSTLRKVFLGESREEANRSFGIVGSDVFVSLSSAGCG